MRRGGRATRTWDDVGLLAAGLLLVVTVVSGWENGANGLPMVVIVVAAVAAYSVGRSATRPLTALTLLWLVAGCTAATVVVWPDVLGGTATADPTGYGNANGALLAMGVVAACGAGIVHRSRVGSASAWLLAAGLLVATLASRSQAAAGLSVLVLALVVITILAPRRGVRAVALWLVAGLTLATLALTVALGLTADRLGRVPGLSTAATHLTERRVQLWHDALSLTREHPVIGVGPGEFPVRSPTARQDADTRQAHSLPLQTAAETGLAGGLAVLVLLAATFAAAAVGARPDVRVLAAGGICIFAAQSLIDYTYRYPVVVLPWALVAGVLTAVRSPAHITSRGDGLQSDGLRRRARMRGGRHSSGLRHRR